MARHPRIHLPGGVYHVMLRGNGGQEIFLDPGDGRQFPVLLAKATVNARSTMRRVDSVKPDPLSVYLDRETGSGLYYCIIEPFDPGAAPCPLARR